MVGVIAVVAERAINYFRRLPAAADIRARWRRSILQRRARNTRFYNFIQSFSTAGRQGGENFSSRSRRPLSTRSRTRDVLRARVKFSRATGTTRRAVYVGTRKSPPSGSGCIFQRNNVCPAATRCRPTNSHPL